MQSLSRLDVLAAAAAAASLVLPAADRRLAAPEPRKITAVLIAAAQKEGKVSCFSVVELPVAKNSFANLHDLKWMGIVKAKPRRLGNHHDRDPANGRHPRLGLHCGVGKA